MEKFIALILGLAALGVIIKIVYFPPVPDPAEYAAKNTEHDLRLEWKRGEGATVHLHLSGSVSNKGKHDLSVLKLMVPYKLTIQPGDTIIKKEIAVDVGPLKGSSTKKVDQRLSTEEVPERVNIALWYEVNIKSASY